MQTKLTLRLDDQLIGHAKHYAERNGISLSQLVASYFKLLRTRPKRSFKSKELPPKTRSLLGVIARRDKKDHLDFLNKKYR